MSESFDSRDLFTIKQNFFLGLAPVEVKRHYVGVLGIYSRVVDTSAILDDTARYEIE